MAGDSNWDTSKPIDHTLISDLPSIIRSLKESTKIIVAREHRTPAGGNAGAEHVAGSARAYIGPELPSIRPDGSILSSSRSDGEEYDDGRIAVVTSAGNRIYAFVATSAGISTGWQDVSVAVANTSHVLDASSDIAMNGYTIRGIGNDTPIYARRYNAPATAIEMIKVNTSDVTELPAGSVLASTAAIQTAAAIACQQHISDAVAMLPVLGAVASNTFISLTTTLTTIAGLTVTRAFDPNKDIVIILLGGYNSDNNGYVRFQVEIGDFSGTVDTIPHDSNANTSSQYCCNALGFALALTVPSSYITGSEQTITVKARYLTHHSALGNIVMIYMQPA